jgi:putative glycosyltransferase (TIGR04348 family)
MKAHTIAIVTPAQRGSRSGNRISAERYARLFCALGQRVRVLDAWDHKPADVLVVLNATRSARSLLAARVQYPKLAIILVLTGTDVYGRRARGRGFERVIEAADCIVGLQAHTVDQLAPRRRARARTILQSYDGPKLEWRAPVRAPVFLVLGHLRREKDPLRAALAARLLPESSKVSVQHAGKALSAHLGRRARRESERNPRYTWLGELTRARALRKLSRSTALVLSSRIEGGPGVISEALGLGVPVLASRIPSSVAILGARHPGLFDVERQDQLAALMLRIEREPRFLESLAAHSRRLRPKVDPARESLAWQRCLRAALLAARRRSSALHQRTATSDS